MKIIGQTKEGVVYDNIHSFQFIGIAMRCRIVAYILDPRVGGLVILSAVSVPDSEFVAAICQLVNEQAAIMVADKVIHDITYLSWFYQSSTGEIMEIVFSFDKKTNRLTLPMMQKRDEERQRSLQKIIDGKEKEFDRNLCDIGAWTGQD